MSEIKERLAHVMDRIESARKRSPYGQEVTLVAVTKFHPLEDMEEAIHLGVTRWEKTGSRKWKRSSRP